ncbi:MAG: RluA family pseudouridine synthase [Verrucomicrobia bacterium]|nr:RluA family pseudouridine synthase [Verrucomicrobiota bacterium]
MKKIGNSEKYRFSVSEKADVGLRLDQFLVNHLNGLSRSRVQQLIKDNTVLVDGNTAKAKLKLTIGNEVLVEIPEPIVMEDVEPQDIPLDVIYEDDDFIVINKTSGIVVHPAAGNPDGTLVNALLYHCQGELSGIGGVQRPGIIHRLDKDTSGCLVAAKNNLAHQEISRQFADRETTKIYHCVVQGSPSPSSGRIENQIGRHPVNRQKMTVLEPPAGKRAKTDYKTLREGPGGRANWTFIECHLHTGRTHQIRVHMKSLGCPILGDVIYAQPSRQNPSASRLLLHASRLSFTHPSSKEPLSFTSPLPEAFSVYSSEPISGSCAHPAAGMESKSQRRQKPL